MTRYYGTVCIYVDVDFESDAERGSPDLVAQIENEVENNVFRGNWSYHESFDEDEDIMDDSEEE